MPEREGRRMCWLCSVPAGGVLPATHQQVLFDAIGPEPSDAGQKHLEPVQPAVVLCARMRPAGHSIHVCCRSMCWLVFAAVRHTF